MALGLRPGPTPGRKRIGGPPHPTVAPQAWQGSDLRLLGSVGFPDCPLPGILLTWDWPRGAPPGSGLSSVGVGFASQHPSLVPPPFLGSGNVGVCVGGNKRSRKESQPWSPSGICSTCQLNGSPPGPQLGTRIPAPAGTCQVRAEGEGRGVVSCWAFTGPSAAGDILSSPW